MWDGLPLSQLAFIKDRSHHFKTNHCPGAWKESVGFCCRSQFCSCSIIVSHPVVPHHLIPGVVDAINCVTKTKLTAATQRRLLDPDEGKDVKKLDNSTLKGGKKVSIAGEMARWLTLDGCEGAKSVRKNQKKENQREFKKHHWIVRDANVKLSGLKCEGLELGKGAIHSEMHHIYSCPELGPQKIAVRRIPCHCFACRQTLKLGWKNGLKNEEQPHFKTVPNCKLKRVLGNFNRWCVCKLRQRSQLDANWNPFMDEEADQMREDIQEHLSAVIVEQIVIGEVGAVATPDVNTDGCHLMKFTSEPFHCEKRQNLVVKGKHLNPVGGAPFWYTDSEVEVTHLVHHVVLGLVLMEEISDENPLPRRGCNRPEATRLNAKKIARHDHDYIIE